MTRTVYGVVHGKTIELLDELGVADGERVEIQVRTLACAARMKGEGLLRTEGALADDTEWDDVMDEIYQARKIERRGADLEGT